MNYKKYIRAVLNTVLPFVLGGGILYWMYREYDFEMLSDTLAYKMNWWWMAFSMIFGVAAQVFRGLRWKQSLDPLGEHPRLLDCVYAVFISYASSLIIPRSGEFTRCGVLSKYDGVSFSKAIGTVVSERIIDSLLMLIMIAVVFIFQLRVFDLFFDKTGTDIVGKLQSFTATGYYVTVLCLVVTCVFLWFILRRFAFMSRVKAAMVNVTEGIMSLRGVEKKWLFAFYSVMIWVSYFLHYWITFYCFDFTENLGLTVAMVSFVVGSISVIVPTPNGAGPWHFSVKTILILYGVAVEGAETFVFIVFALQTALVPLLGIVAMCGLAFRKK